MVVKPVVVMATILMTAMLLVPFISLDDYSADSTCHVIFYDGEGNVLDERDWAYRVIPYCVDDPSAPDGERFVGWSTDPNPTSSQDMMPVESDTEFYPVFVSSDSVYSITFDPMNDVDQPRELYKAKGSSFTIPGLDELGFVVKDDYGSFVLDSWSDAAGSRYSVGDVVVVSSDMSLTASWVRLLPVLPMFEVDLPSSMVVERFDEASLSVKCNDIEGDGLTYEWYLDDGISESFLATGPQMPLPDTMVSYPGEYMVYVKVTNTDRTAVSKAITVDSNVCTVTVRPSYLLSICGTDYVSLHSEGNVVDLTSVKKDGHTLVDILLPDGTPVSDGKVTIPGYDLVLTPVWQKEMYDVTYLSEGNILFEGTYAYGDMIPLMGAPVKDGFEFEGWSYSDDLYQPSYNLRVESDLTFEAKWIPASASCVVDGAGVSGDTYVLGSEGVLYWYDSDGIRYLPGETVRIKDGCTYTSVPI